MTVRDLLSCVPSLQHPRLMRSLVRWWCQRLGKDVVTQGDTLFADVDTIWPGDDLGNFDLRLSAKRPSGYPSVGLPAAIQPPPSKGSSCVPTVCDPTLPH